jgi:hypothetical protein
VLSDATLPRIVLIVGVLALLVLIVGTVITAVHLLVAYFAIVQSPLARWSMLPYWVPAGSAVVGSLISVALPAKVYGVRAILKAGDWKRKRKAIIDYRKRTRSVDSRKNS